MFLQPVHVIFCFYAVLCVVSSALRSVAEPLHVPLSRSIHRNHFTAAPGTVARSDPVRNTNIRRQFQFFDFTTPFYFAEISIGTPPQKFKMMVDIGISTIMVSAKDCSGCPPGSPFDAIASPTFANKSTPSIDFSYLGGNMNGNISGFISDDTIAVGSLSVAKGEFLQMTDLLSTGLPDSVSGVLGLAFGAAGGTTAAPFWKTLIAANEAAAPEMGFWLSRDLAADNEQDSEQEFVGEFTFGGVNSSLYSGDIEFLNLAAGSAVLGSWTLEISAITVGTKAVSITPNATLAMFDSTFNSISGPGADVAAIYAAIPGSSGPLTGTSMFLIPCNTTVSVSLSFGGQTWSISAKDLVQDPVESGDCVGAFGGAPPTQSPGWRVGIPFLRNVYSVLRETPPSIGFAQLSTIAGGTGTPNATASTGGSSSTSSSSSSTSSSPGSTGTALKTKSNTAAVAGGVSAGIILLLLLLAGVIFYRWRRKRRTDPANYDVSAFHYDVETAPTGPSESAAVISTGMSKSFPSTTSVSTSAALMPMKRAQIEAVNLYRSEASNDMVQTAEGLHLYPGTSSHLPESSHSASPPELSPPDSSADPAILQELQTLRHEVRWLTQRTGDEPPPIYT
ncbi:aspartic peptidase domain-containing protein [Mycena galopus ATCC 62051]|nr:aspartic peptidase domain-containing protein [Mycena galopus ATCC 62051]